VDKRRGRAKGMERGKEVSTAEEKKGRKEIGMTRKKK